MTTMQGPLCANPRWSPDGSRILFTSRREGSQDLYLLVPETREVRRITDDPGEEVEPRWSRDGRSIYFGSNRSGRVEVWKMPADGGAAIQVTRNGGLTATESADGRLLYYGKRPGWPTSIWQVPVGGGEETLVVDGVTDQKNFVVARRGLYFLASALGPRGSSLDYFDLAARKRRTLFSLEKRWWFGMAISPDERSLLYAQIDDEGGNLMLVESFEGR
jgi:Tol biopolymer transport system component